MTDILNEIETKVEAVIAAVEEEIKEIFEGEPEEALPVEPVAEVAPVDETVSVEPVEDPNAAPIPETPAPVYSPEAGTPAA